MVPLLVHVHVEDADITGCYEAVHHEACEFAVAFDDTDAMKYEKSIVIFLYESVYL